MNINDGGLQRRSNDLENRQTRVYTLLCEDNHGNRVKHYRLANCQHDYALNIAHNSESR
jgi:hypothetical protein